MSPRRARSVPRQTQVEALDVLHARLSEHYGTPRPKRRRPPLDEVVLTILSQNTSDTNRDRAWASLKGHFPTWAQVADAECDEVEAAIQVGGLQRIKARRIQEIVRQVRERHGESGLDHLRSFDAQAARAELSAYKGLGEKSVNCIMLFSLGHAAFPVDTHVFRVLRRIGVHQTRDLSKANVELQDVVDERMAFPLHMNVIRHGRTVCHARRPECWRCAIEDLCGYDSKSIDPVSETVNTRTSS